MKVAAIFLVAVALAQVKYSLIYNLNVYKQLIIRK